MSTDTNKEIYRPEYSPAPEVPSWFEARLRALGLRVVWGMDARGFPWPDNRQVKYVSPNDPEIGWACFILEQYVGPEFFGDPDEWEKNRWVWSDEGKRVEVMAPYPSRGEWVFVQQLATPDGDPMPLTEQVADYISMLVHVHHTTPHNGYTQQKLIAERIEKIQRLREERRRAGAEQLEINFDESARTAAITNARQSRVWNKLSQSALSGRVRRLFNPSKEQR